MRKPKPWPVVKESVFARDLHFLSHEARGIERKRKTDAEVTAYQRKGHGRVDLCLPEARKHMLNQGGAV